MIVSPETIALSSLIATFLFLFIIGIIGVWYGGRGKKVRALQCIGYGMIVLAVIFLIANLV